MKRTSSAGGRHSAESWLVPGMVTTAVLMVSGLGASAMILSLAAVMLAQVGLGVFYRKPISAFVSRLRRSQTTDGVVTGHEVAGKDGRAERVETPTVRFTPLAGGDPIEAAAKSLGHETAVGDVVEVRYDPRDGSVLHLTARERHAVALLGLLFGGSTLSGIAVMVFLLMRGG